MKKPKLSFILRTLYKGNIDEHISPYLSNRKRGPKPKFHTNQIVMIIHYRLKTGCQWRELLVKQFTEGVSVGWNAIFTPLQKVVIDGLWKCVWINLLAKKRPV